MALGRLVTVLIRINEHPHFGSHICFKQRWVTLVKTVDLFQLVPVQRLELSTDSTTISIPRKREGSIAVVVIPKVNSPILLVNENVLVHYFFSFINSARISW